MGEILRRRDVLRRSVVVQDAAILLALVAIAVTPALHAQRPVTAPLLRGDSAPGSGQAVPPPAPLLLKGARVLDVVAGRYEPAFGVLVEGGRVSAVLRAEAATLPQGTQVVDLAGQTLVPGLGDMHARAFPDADVDADYFYALGLASGVTMYRVLEAPVPWAVRQRDRVADGLVLAPWLWTGGPLLDQAAGPDMAVRTVGDPDSLRMAIAAQLKAGVDWISLGSHVGPDLVKLAVAEVLRSNPPGPPRGPTPRAGPRGSVRSAADPAGPRLAVSAGTTPMLMLAGIRVGSIEGFGLPIRTREEYEARIAEGKAHSGPIPDLVAWAWERITPAERKALVSALAGSGTALVPLAASGVECDRITGLDKDPALTLLPVAKRERIVAVALQKVPGNARRVRDQVWREQARVLVDLVRAKGRVVTGSDWGGSGFAVPGAAIQREIGLYVQAGLTPAEAIRTATLSCAALVGSANTRGQIRPGFRADLFAVEGDPLSRVEDLGRITLVVLGGETLAPSELIAQAKRAMRPR